MKFQKIGVLLLALLIMVGSVAACGTPETQEKDSKAPVDDTEPVAATPAESKESNDVYAFTLLGNITNEMKDWDKAYIKKIDEELNLDITVELPPATSYQERLQMMLASGDYAEASLVMSHTDKMFLDAVKDEFFIPLNEYLENAPNLMEYSYDISWDTLKVMGDDNIYGIPRTSIARADGYVVRKDWMDAVGFTDFTEGENMTLDQFEEMITLFTENDPDGNGVDDTYGLTSYSNDVGNIDILIGPAFGILGWEEIDGEFMHPKYSRTQDNFKKALQWSQDMWKKGVIDPDWPTIKVDISQDRFKKGNVGVMAEFAGWLTDTETEGKKMNPDFELAYITGIVGEEGAQYGNMASTTGAWGQWVIANNATQPQRIVDMFDYMLSDEGWPDTKYGYEGMTYERQGEDFIATDQYDSGCIGRSIVRRNNDPSFFLSLDQNLESRNRIENLIDIAIKQYEFPLDKGYRPSIADDPVFIDYEKHMAVQVSKIIVGELPVDEWDNLLDGWYEAGGDQYVKEKQEYIASQEEA